MLGILSSFGKAEITIEELETMWEAEIKDAWEKAYAFGVRSVGNPFGIWEEDRSWMRGAVKGEFRYLGEFVNDIRNRN